MARGLNLDTMPRRRDKTEVPRLLALIVLLAACRGGAKDGATCETVAGAFQTMAKAELLAAKVDDATQRAVADQIPAMRDALVAVCKDGAWSAQVRDCMAKAADHVALQACESGLSDDQRRAIDKSTQGQSGDQTDDTK